MVNAGRIGKFLVKGLGVLLSSSFEFRGLFGWGISIYDVLPSPADRNRSIENLKAFLSASKKQSENKAKKETQRVIRVKVGASDPPGSSLSSQFFGVSSSLSVAPQRCHSISWFPFQCPVRMSLIYMHFYWFHTWPFRLRIVSYRWSENAGSIKIVRTKDWRNVAGLKEKQQIW